MVVYKINVSAQGGLDTGEGDDTACAVVDRHPIFASLTTAQAVDPLPLCREFPALPAGNVSFSLKVEQN
jgi:hypothetical protein